MRKFLLVVWLLVPVAAAAYHFGPGQEKLVLDDVAALVMTAEDHVKSAEAITAEESSEAARGEWELAEAAYEEALALLPADRAEAGQRLRLERAKVQMFVSKLPTAHGDLEILVDELAANSTDAELLADARDALANSQYYITWLMRLEGASREEWEPKIEGARQNYKWLAEQAQESQDAVAVAQKQRNLEAAIRLARMDLQELQGLPLPSQ